MRTLRPLASAAVVLCTAWAATAQGPSAPPADAAPAKKPNILILWGDDIGLWNISAYNLGAMWDPLESTCRHASLSIL